MVHFIKGVISEEDTHITEVVSKLDTTGRLDAVVGGWLEGRTIITFNSGYIVSI